MASKADTVKQSSGITGLFGLIPYFQDSWLELRKVHHPTRQETIQATIVVMAMVIAVALFLGAVDMVLAWVMHLAMG
jgi:preprotein translocase SecE subunit